jgi:hypothetical protein
MNDEVQHLSRRMAEDGAKTAGFFNDLSTEDWEQQVYTTGSEWTAKDILAHFVSAERAFVELLTDIVSGGPGAPRDLDIVAFNEQEVPSLRTHSTSDLLSAFVSARQKTADIASQMTAEDLNKQGYHPWFGEVDLRSMVKLVYRHNMIHLRDIRKALGNNAPVPHLDIAPPAANDGFGRGADE